MEGVEPEKLAELEPIRNVLELKPGVKLEGLMEGDILVIREQPELVTMVGPILIQTIRRPTMEEVRDEGIEVTTRWIREYDIKKGDFRSNGFPQLERMGDKNYKEYNQLLTEMEEALR